LNKSNAGAGVTSIAGALVIGNDAGDGTHLDVVHYGADDQIAANQVITVQSTGVLDLNGHNQTLSLAAAGFALRLRDGVTFSAQVQTGSG
ncbi:hypothetical protein ACO1MB_14065, partial [Staphylococcus aureus]